MNMNRNKKMRLISLSVVGLALLGFIISPLQALGGGPMGPEERALRMIERAELQNDALSNNLLFGLISPDDTFDINGTIKTISEWHLEVEDGINSAHQYFDAADFEQAKMEAEAAKDIADFINNAYGFTIGYWAHKGAFSRGDFSILLIQDDNHHNEWATDTLYIKGILDGLGYDVTFTGEGVLLNSFSTAVDMAENFKNYNVVWLSNPGWPFDDAITIAALKIAMDSGVGIVLQGDDAIYSILDPGLLQVKDISGLNYSSPDPNGTWADNNMGNVYEVTVGLGHPLQTGIALTQFNYGDDIDTCTSVGASIVASATPVFNPYPFPQKPVIAAFHDTTTGGKSITILLTVEQLEEKNIGLDPLFDDTLCDNVILWVAN
jgi:hypothetical protein